MHRLGLLGLVALLAFSACTKAGGSSAEGGRANSWTQPHVLSITSASGDINTLNPHLGQFQDIFYMSSMTQAWLIKWDEHNNPYPELATAVPTKANGGVSQDGLTITYHLRKGVKWSDGAPFDADDVVFSTGVVLNMANNEVGRLGWDQITKTDEPDKFTVIYHLKKPYSPFVETFFSTVGANPSILPKHLLAKYPNINNIPYNALPVGIGPFKYERWDRAEQVVMVANPLYFRGRPKLDKIVWKLIPDRNTALSEIQAHEVDMWVLIPGNYMTTVQTLTPYTMIRQPSYLYNHIDFNLQHPVDADPIVRQALRYAIDREEIKQKIAHGLGTVSDVTTPLTAPYYAAGLGVTPFDLNKANALLDGDGWKRGPDGIRSKNGLRMEFSLATISGSQDVDKQIELIRANWKKIGADITVQHYSTASYYAPVQSGGIFYGTKWDIALGAWSNDAIGDQSAIYGCQSFPPSGQNVLRWCNKIAQSGMDALFGHYEQLQRNADVRLLQEQLIKDVPTIVTTLREDVFAYNKDLKNWHPSAVTPFDNMMDVDI